MFYIDQSTKETKRFLVGPVGCEITGLAYTPDLTTFFVNIQHPTGDWPVAGEEPRSSTVVVRRTDGTPVGTKRIQISQQAAIPKMTVPRNGGSLSNNLELTIT